MISKILISIAIGFGSLIGLGLLNAASKFIAHYIIGYWEFFSKAKQNIFAKIFVFVFSILFGGAILYGTLDWLHLTFGIEFLTEFLPGYLGFVVAMILMKETFTKHFLLNDPLSSSVE